MSSIWQNCVIWSNLTHFKSKTIVQSKKFSACVSVLCIVRVCVCVCVSCVKNHRIDVQGSVFTSLGLSVSGRDPLMPTDSFSKNAFGMLNRRSKWINHKKQNSHTLRTSSVFQRISASCLPPVHARGDKDLLNGGEEWAWPYLRRLWQSSDLNEMWGQERCLISGRLLQKFCGLAYIVHGCRIFMN